MRYRRRAVYRPTGLRDRQNADFGGRGQTAVEISMPNSIESRLATYLLRPSTLGVHTQLHRRSRLNEIRHTLFILPYRLNISARV